MSVTAKVLLGAKFAAASNTTEYTVPASTRTIIDKFTATNTDGSARTISVHLIPSGQSVGDAYLIVDALSIATGVTADLTELQNQILAEGDVISCVASDASMVVIRASGREIT